MGKIGVKSPCVLFRQESKKEEKCEKEKEIVAHHEAAQNCI